MTVSAAEPVDRLPGRASERLYRWGASAGIVTLTGLTLVLFQSIFWAGHVPFPLKLGIAGVAVFSVVRPANGLLVVAGLSPLGYMLTTRVAGALPARITEAIALAFFAGYALRSVWARFARRGGETSPGSARSGDAKSLVTEPLPHLLTPVLLFSAVAIASCVVHYHFMQAWHDHPWPFLQRFVDFLVWGYHGERGNLDPTVSSAGFGFVITTAFVVEGAALFLAAFTFCARDPLFLSRLVTMVVAGAVGAASLSFYALARAALSEADPLGALPTLLAQRWTMFTPKLNTAASLFVLAGPLAIGAAAAAVGRRSWWIAGTVVLVMALWINGTRVALLAAILVLAGTVVWFASRRLRWRTLRSPVIIGLVMLGLGLAGTAFHRLYVDRAAAREALGYRYMFNETALRMFASAPVFGVGVDQYYLQSEDFAPEELLSAYRRVPAHNPFLQTAAELGMVGVVPFTWMIGLALWMCVTAVRKRASDAYLFGSLAGLTAFLITSASSGHPLLIEVTAYPFWIVLGLAAARASWVASAADATTSGGQGPEAADAPPAVAPIWGRRCAVLGVVLLAVSLPARITLQARGIDFTEVTYGLYDWEEAAGVRWRWTSSRVTMFVDAGTTAIELPLRAPQIEITGPMSVEIFLDGQLANRLELTHADWRPIRMTIPPSDQRYRRLELTVSPTWFPAVVLDGSTDPRELGIMVGEIRRSSAGAQAAIAQSD